MRLILQDRFIIIIIIICEFFTLSLTGVFPLTFEWQQVSSKIQDSSMYPSWFYKYFSLFFYFYSYLLFSQTLLHVLGDCYKGPNYDWCHCYLNVQQPFQLSNKVKVFIQLFACIHFLCVVRQWFSLTVLRAFSKLRFILVYWISVMTVIGLHSDILPCLKRKYHSYTCFAKSFIKTSSKNYNNFSSSLSTTPPKKRKKKKKTKKKEKEKQNLTYSLCSFKKNIYQPLRKSTNMLVNIKRLEETKESIQKYVTWKSNSE